MRWTEQKAWEWQKSTGWLLGFNYVPSNAVNSTEMWQKETFGRETIKRELSIAAETGYNSCRVFLQYIVWENERGGFLETFGDFCEIAKSAGISVMPILFDDCAFAGKEPYPGKQNPPVPGVHNSGWTPSPGITIADNPEKEQDLCDYVKNIIESFKGNNNIIAWDLYNEPGNNGRGEKCLPLLQKSFEWARGVEPAQPLTAGIWEYKNYDLSFAGLSDVISYHDYMPPAESEKKIEALKKYNRPLLCTEWLNRPAGNTFQSHLPLYKRENTGIYNWGLVNGRTQTNLHWSTMGGKPDSSPEIWQHDIFKPDGAPYDESEINLIRQYK
ncbi:MAG: cellulase family glycosylhydrolase [Oscillospiraceae bacterium]|nr:cellulase family glycosylhydrolase [Oscillospiraceae bacterium]